MSLTQEAPSTPTIDFEGPYRLSIGGQLVEAPDTFEVFNPATGEVLAHAPSASAEQMESAIAAAKGPSVVVGAPLGRARGVRDALRRRP